MFDKSKKICYEDLDSLIVATRIMCVPMSARGDSVRHGGSQVIVRVLGPVDIVVQPQWHGKFSKQTKRVLALLAAAGKKHLSTDRLVTEVWRGRSPASARDMIHRQISRIRSILNDNEHAILRADSTGYWLDRTICEVDAEQFIRLMDRGREEYTIGHLDQAGDALEKALSLWWDIKAFQDVRDNYMLDEFANYLEMRQLEAGELLVDSYLRSQRIHQALQELARLTTRHPTREPFWARLMLAQVLDGSTADASTTFNRVRRSLCRDYGLDPSPFLCQVYETVLRCPTEAELFNFLTPSAHRTTLCKSVTIPLYGWPHAAPS